MDTQTSLDANHRAEELARRDRYRSDLSEWWERTNRLACEWDLETVKQMVVLNAAGIAGVATLLASSKTWHPKWVGHVSLTLYGLGVILSILNMYFASQALMQDRDEIKTRIMKTWDLAENMAGIFNDLSAGARFRTAGVVCGWIAAVLAVISTIALGFSLAS